MRSRWIGSLCVAMLLPGSLLAGPASARTHPLKCSPGKVKARQIEHTAGGRFLVEATERNEFEFFVCVVGPNFRTSRQKGVDLRPFKSGRFFKTDPLGHVFYKLDPGQVPGVGVVVFNRIHEQQLGIYANATIIKPKDDAPYAIRVGHNDCNPDCASGRTTYKTLRWNTSTRRYS